MMHAVNAIEGASINGSEIRVSWSKPVTINHGRARFGKGVPAILPNPPQAPSRMQALPPVRVTLPGDPAVRRVIDLVAQGVATNGIDFEATLTPF